MSTDLPSPQVTRRQFLRTAATAAIAAPTLIPASVLGGPGQAPPSERINLGIIGCGGMGRGNLGACARQPDVVVTGACDVWRQRREAVCQQYKAPASPTPTTARCSSSKDLDAVIIATPPHWHCPDGRRRLRGRQGHLPAKADDAAPGREPGRPQRRQASISGSARSARRSTPARTTAAWSS